ncbi:hypothetical protein Gogos_011500 [Gossypium gossypioides]|uniref:Uncharacterized protein n=1 Tax=Gossypium gossypioides TaxID=34282 RepID=A0A7J9BPJ5_GOSGO|nr:hypothetical protein [Gossypium gossypioides]
MSPTEKYVMSSRSVLDNNMYGQFVDLQRKQVNEFVEYGVGNPMDVRDDPVWHRLCTSIWYSSAKSTSQQVCTLSTIRQDRGGKRRLITIMTMMEMMMIITLFQPLTKRQCFSLNSPPQRISTSTVRAEKAKLNLPVGGYQDICGLRLRQGEGVDGCGV